MTSLVEYFLDAQVEESGEALCETWQGTKGVVVRYQFVRTTYPIVKYRRTIVSATQEDEVKTAMRRARRLWLAART